MYEAVSEVNYTIMRQMEDTPRKKNISSNRTTANCRAVEYIRKEISIMERKLSQSKVLCDGSPQKPFHTTLFQLHGRMNVSVERDSYR